ncbi:hypothetical protein [Vacuolonema iberomarrocanum]|uniref:hypothetical protein n=1 Tax=Vacuolonema iberomarrocanum TaxID=3454632 RepID=UPI0019DD8B63|nr:hypothetical protein [filamentous cyanobacterium LEGE 07170]
MTAKGAATCFIVLRTELTHFVDGVAASQPHHQQNAIAPTASSSMGRSHAVYVELSGLD